MNEETLVLQTMYTTSKKHLKRDTKVTAILALATTHFPFLAQEQTTKIIQSWTKSIFPIIFLTIEISKSFHGK